jgi:hypothetical protein
MQARSFSPIIIEESPQQQLLLDEWFEWIRRDDGKHLLDALLRHHAKEESRSDESSIPFVISLDETSALELAALNPLLLHSLIEHTGMM